jgi:ABC-type Na+ efflux pump permease subunit
MAADPGFDPESVIQRLAPMGAGLIVVGVAFSSLWSIPVIVAGLILLGASCWSRRDGFLLFGPFIGQELRTTIRRTRVHLWRTVLVLLAGIAFVGAASVRSFQPNASAVQLSGTLLILGTAYVLSISLLPLGLQRIQATIAGEREAKRLDFLLMTDLRNREIVLGRGVGRSALPIFFLFSLLPFAVVIPPLFGVPTLLVLVPTAYGILTFLSAGALSLYASTTSRTVKRSNPKVTLFIFPFFVLTMGIEFLRYVPEVWSAVFNIPGLGLVAVGDLLEYISVANPLALFIRIVTGLTGGMDVLDLATEWLPIYAAYHLAFCLIGVMKSAQILRWISAELAGEGPLGSTETGGRQLDKPTVTDRPILWKEQHFHELLPKTKAGRRTSQFFGALFGYIPAIVILGAGLSGWPPIRDLIAKGLVPILPVMVWILVCVGIRIAAGVIARERERNTLTSLIMTPISPKEIISDKWHGCLYAQGGGFLWLLMLGVPAVLTGLYPGWAFAGLMILALSFQCVVASVGVLASVAGATVEKANQSAVWKGLLGTAVQGIVAAIFSYLALSKLFPEGKYFAVACFPFGSLIAIGFVQSCPTDEIPYWCLAGLAAAIHMGLISWIVFRRAVRKFERLSEEGILDTDPATVQ